MKGPPLRRILPAPLCSLLETSKLISVSLAPLQSWFIASSMYPTGDNSVVYVTIWLLLDNIGGDSDFCWFWGVCVSITCSYHVQLLDPLAGSPKCQNGWHNIISGAGAEQIAGLSLLTRGSLLQ